MIENIDKGLDTADSILTKIGKIFGKHWGKILILAVAGLVYWVFTLPPIYQEEPQINNEIIQPTEESMETLEDSSEYFEPEIVDSLQ